MKTLGLSEVQASLRLKSDCKSRLKVFREGSNPFDHAWSATSSLDSECAWSCLLWFEFRNLQNDFGAALDQRQGRANLDGWPQFLDGYDDYLFISLGCFDGGGFDHCTCGWC